MSLRGKWALDFRRHWLKRPLANSKEAAPVFAGAARASGAPSRLIIPRQVASQQSLTPFHQVQGCYFACRNGINKNP
jgi:hypothetical protein